MNNELLDRARKAVRRYAEGIRDKDRQRQLAYEDALVAWIVGRVREAEAKLKKAEARVTDE